MSARIGEEASRRRGDQLGGEIARRFGAGAEKTGSFGSNMKFLGYGLILLAALQIVGGVMCFSDKSAMFVLGIGAVGLIVEVADLMIVFFKFGNVLGVVTAALAIVAGLQMKSAAKGAPPANAGGAPPAPQPPKPL